MAGCRVDGTERPAESAVDDEGAGVRLHDEEGSGSESSPLKDLLSAALIAIFALAVIVLSLGLDVPDTLYTAPGLLPLVTGLALLGMAAALAYRAVRAGATRRRFLGSLLEAERSNDAAAEDWRALLLAGLVLLYVWLVARWSFELRLRTPAVDLALSGYEVVSVVIVAAILKVFWRAPLLRCGLVALLGVEVLALAFRYGFHMIMPEVF